MPVGTLEKSVIEDLLAATEGGPDLGARLRASLPGLVVTACDAEDIDNPSTPFLQHPSVQIHLVDGSNHCWALTRDPDKATGLLIARRRKGK